MGPRDEDAAAALSRSLGGTVRNLVRLSSGASRITSSFDLLASDGSVRPLVLQQERGDASGQGSKVGVQASLLAAAHAGGVPVPLVVAAGAASGLDPGWLVTERLEGETIPRRILRDPGLADARAALTHECASALAAIHRINPDDVPGLPRGDPFRDARPLLDALGMARPVLELGVRWLARDRPAAGATRTVHGDFRMGNLLVGPDGLRAVLDWELAHAGDPAEDLGWLCARSWRFGGPGHVGGFGDLTTLLDDYAGCGGEVVEPSRVTWWEAYAAVKWAVICALQASAHLGGSTRSVELAAIGRRVCESEWDLCVLLGFEPDEDPPAATLGETPPFGRPTASELLEAVGEYVERGTPAGEGDRTRYEARVASNVLRIVARELELGPAISEGHARRLEALGCGNDAALAASLRSGEHDDALDAVGVALAASTRDQLLVANPSYLLEPG